MSATNVGGANRRPLRVALRRAAPASTIPPDGRAGPDRRDSRRSPRSPPCCRTAPRCGPRRRRAAGQGKRPHQLPRGRPARDGRCGRRIPRRLPPAGPAAHAAARSTPPAIIGWPWRSRIAAQRRLGADDDHRRRAVAVSYPGFFETLERLTPVTADKIYLVGFMAAGKTTVARALAARLGWRAEDIDELIEARERLTVADIFARTGEPYFRAVEREILKLAAAAAPRRRRHRRRHVRRPGQSRRDQPGRRLGLARRAARGSRRAASGRRPAAAGRRPRQMERLFDAPADRLRHGAPAHRRRRRLGRRHRRAHRRRLRAPA